MFKDKEKFGLVILVLIGFLHSGFASAATLSLVPDTINTVETNSFDVDVVISDLGTDLVGAFDITVGFEPSLLTATGVAFSGNLGLTNVETLASFDLNSASVNAFEVSFLPVFEIPPYPTLSGLQPDDSVLLATLTFIAIGKGSSSLGFTSWEFADALGDRIIIDDPSGAHVEISAVPLPGALWLMLSGLLAVGAMARRRSS